MPPQPSILSHTQGRAATDQLLTWYREHRRDLPWRREHRPYCVWISEIMAQQTRITALLPYYQRFMEAFPTLEALAQADVDEVLRLWAGLGYYRRAHHLHQAARLMVKNYEGKVPENYAQLCRLPGIGDYTASAICSIAFGQPLIPIDGNISRVFARLANCEIPVTRASFKQHAKEFLSPFIPPQASGDFAQALMELGSLVCLPKHPRCDACPLTSCCQARATDRQQDLPVLARPKEFREEQWTVALIFDQAGNILLRKREKDLLKGLWEYYALEGWLKPPELTGHLESHGLYPKRLVSLGRTSHAFSHLIWHMQGYACEVKECYPVPGYSFVPYEKLQQLALPTALRFYTDWLSQNLPLSNKGP